MIRIFAALLVGLACTNALALDDARLEPGMTIEIPFGAPRGNAIEPRLSARLDYRADPAAGLFGPALLEWRLDGQRSTVELYGMKLTEGAGYRLDATPGEKVATGVGIGATATVVMVGVAALFVIEVMLGGIGEALDATAGGFGPPAEDDAAAACSGVEVGEECLAGG